MGNSIVKTPNPVVICQLRWGKNRLSRVVSASVVKGKLLNYFDCILESDTEESKMQKEDENKHLEFEQNMMKKVSQLSSELFDKEENNSQ